MLASSNSAIQIVQYFVGNNRQLLRIVGDYKSLPSESLIIGNYYRIVGDYKNRIIGNYYA